MNIEDYQNFVASTSRANPDRIADLFMTTKYASDQGIPLIREDKQQDAHTRNDARELLAAMGIAGEGGEVLEHYKKWLFHKKERDFTAIALEIGDVLWYVFLWCEATGIPFTDILAMNEQKLNARRAARERQFADDARAA
jgi:NTP pyrophosphatase (non-canonical NTP hydrolase)